MSKLKTLKDLEFSSDNFLILKQLKQEAIKWVKHWNKNVTIHNAGSIIAFKSFFNITEEDLK